MLSSDLEQILYTLSSHFIQKSTTWAIPMIGFELYLYICLCHICIIDVIKDVASFHSINGCGTYTNTHLSYRRPATRNQLVKTVVMAEIHMHCKSYTRT